MINYTMLRFKKPPNFCWRASGKSKCM